MSSHEDTEPGTHGAAPGAEPAFAALAALEATVSRAIERIESLRARNRQLEGRVAELEDTVRNLTSGAIDAQTLLNRLKSLEQENHELRRRIDSGRQAVERLLARIRFLEEQQ